MTEQNQAALVCADHQQVPQGWRFVRRPDGIGIFAPPPKPGESPRTNDTVPASNRDLYDLLGKLADQQAAAPEAPAQADRQRVPDGWKLVPVQPTQEMLKELGDAWEGVNRATWQWVIAAAPEAPALKHVPLTDERIIEVLGDTKHSQITAVRALIAESHAAPEAHAEQSSERHLRRLLAVRVGMPNTYYDDGEAQGSEHGIYIDFMREPVADIEAKLRALNVARAAMLAAAPEAPTSNGEPQ